MFHQWFFQKVQGHGLFIFKMSSSKLEKLVCDVVIMIVIRRKSRGKAKKYAVFYKKNHHMASLAVRKESFLVYFLFIDSDLLYSREIWQGAATVKCTFHLSL